MELINKVTIFVGGALQVDHKVLEFIGHGVEGRGQFTNFGAAVQVYTLREVSAGDGAAGRVRTSSGLVMIRAATMLIADAQQNGHQRQQRACVAFQTSRGRLRSRGFCTMTAQSSDATGL